MTEKLQPRKGKKKIISVEEMQKHIRNYKPKETVKPEKLNEIVDSSSKDDVYVIKDITLYGLEGKPTKKYNEVELDGSCVLGADGEPVKKTQNDWIEHFKNTDKQFLSLPLLYAIMETAYDNIPETIDSSELLESLKSDFEKSYLVLSTRFNYSQNKIWHDFGTKEQIEIVQNISGGDNHIESLVKKPEWEKPLRAIFMAKDIKKIPEVLRVYNKKTRFWTPTHKREIDVATFVGFLGDHFLVDCESNLNIRCRTRGVKITK